MSYKFLKNIILYFLISFSFTYTEDEIKYKYNIIKEIKTMDKIHSDFLSTTVEIKKEELKTNIEVREEERVHSGKIIILASDDTNEKIDKDKPNENPKESYTENLITDTTVNFEENSSRDIIENKIDDIENKNIEISNPKIQKNNNIENSKIKKFSFNKASTQKTLILKPTLKQVESEITNAELQMRNRLLFKKDEKFEEMNDRTNRVTALGSAMGAIDLGSTPAKKIRLGAGVGNSSSSQAVAVGVGYAPTESLRFNTKFSSSTNAINNNSISIGASYDLDL